MANYLNFISRYLVENWDKIVTWVMVTLTCCIVVLVAIMAVVTILGVTDL